MSTDSYLPIIFFSLRLNILKFLSGFLLPTPPFSYFPVPSFLPGFTPFLSQTKSPSFLTSVLYAFVLIPAVILVFILYDSGLFTMFFSVSDAKLSNNCGENGMALLI